MTNGLWVFVGEGEIWDNRYIFDVGELEWLDRQCILGGVNSHTKGMVMTYIVNLLSSSFPKY